MKVKELLVNLKNKNFNMEKELQVKTYLPIEEKKLIAHTIIEECTFEEGYAVHLDSVQQYLSYVKYMILHHTNLGYSDADYDVLCSTEYEDTTLLNAILELFGEDAAECSRILNLMLDDYMRSNSIEYTVGQFMSSLRGGIGILVDALKNKIENDELEMPSYMDMQKLGDFLKDYIK